jgi:hypothetical protein
MSTLEGLGGSIEIKTDLDGSEKIVRPVEIFSWNIERNVELKDSTKIPARWHTENKRGLLGFRATLSCRINMAEEYGGSDQYILGFRHINQILEIDGNGPEVFHRTWFRLFDIPPGYTMDDMVTGAAYMVGETIIESVDASFSLANEFVVFTFSLLGNSELDLVVDENIPPPTY